jgi:predicted nucleic acid-binding protein
MVDKKLFVDTGAWLAVIDPKDQYHQPASTFYRQVLQAHRYLITTNLVVAETYVNLRRSLSHAAAIGFLDTIKQSSRIECVWSSPDLEDQARQILRKYDDQDFSYVDAVSFALMQEMEITEAFAFDRHFVTAGFVCVPKPYQ